MKKTLLFGLFAFLLLPNLVSADLEANQGVYYSFDNSNLTGSDPDDLTGNGNDGTTDGATTGATGKLSEAFDFDGSNDKVTVPGYASHAVDTSYSFSAWFKLDTTGSNREIIGWSNRAATSDALYYFLGYNSANGLTFGWQEGAAGTGDTIATSFSDTSSFHHVVGVYNHSNNTMFFYVDGSLIGSTGSIDMPAASSMIFYVGQLPWSSTNIDVWDGEIDEFGFWDGEALDSTDVACLYNSGSGRGYYDFGSCGAAPASPYATVKVFDLYDNSTLSGLTVYIGTDSNTTDGSGEATVYNPTGLNYTVDGGSSYFNVSGTATENATVNAETYGALPDLSAYNVEGTNILTFNLSSPETTNTTTDGSSELLLPPNTTTEVNVTAEDYYLGQYNVTTSGKDTGTQNLTGLYQTIVTVNATNAYTGAALSNWTGWLYNNDTGYNYTFNTTGNSSTIYAILGNYTGYLDVYGYSLSDSNTKTLVFDNTTETVSYALYSENSIYMYIRNEETAALITENVTITVTGNSTEDIYYTTTGEYFLENLTDGNYTIKFDATNYSLTTYSVTVADRSSQTLNAYLSPGTDTVTFTILDYDNSQAVEGASIIQQRLINSTWTTVESKSSDITGRAQFTYTIGVKYRFTVSKADYDSKVFDLDPVIFTSYVIRLEQDLLLDSNTGLFDVGITYYPRTFTNEENNSFTLTFSSAGGTLESYGYILDYPGGTNTGAGTNAIGGTFSNNSFLITGATFTDRVNLTYWYKSIYGANKTYNVLFQIDDATDPGTLYDLNNDDFGLGTVEKILIAVLSALFFAGVLTLFGAPILGIVGGMLALGFFTVIGFLSIWITIPTFLVGALIVFGRSSQ